MPLTVYFVRHGESEANVARIFANRVDQPAALTAAGRDQARTLAGMLAALSVSHVYTSPLQRASQTAEVIGTALGAPLSTSDALREYDVGDYEGLPYSGVDAWRWERYEMVERAWRRGERHVRHPGGESLADLEARFLPFVLNLPAAHAPVETLVIVSHGGLYRLTLPILLANVSPELASSRTIGHCEAVVATWDGDRWTCLRWGDERLAPSSTS